MACSRSSLETVGARIAAPDRHVALFTCRRFIGRIGMRADELKNSVRVYVCSSEES